MFNLKNKIMVYISKFNKPKIHDDSEFVGGIVYTPYKSEDEDTEYDFSNSHRLTYNTQDIGNIGSAVFTEDSQSVENTEPIDTSSLKLSNENYEDEEESQQDLTYQRKTFTPKPGLDAHYNQFVNDYMRAGAPENELPFWANIAQTESAFTSNVHGRTKDGKYETLGYFQMLTKANGKPMDVAGQYSGVSHETFLNDPIIQIQAAQRMKEHVLSQLTDRDWEAAREKGYTTSAIVAGAWAGGLDGFRKWIHKGINAVDANVRNHPDANRRWAASIAGRMEACNGYFKNGGTLLSPKEVRNIMKNSKGGTLKFSTGGGFERYIENNRDHINNIYSHNTVLGFGDIGYKDTLMTYRRNSPGQLLSSTKDDKTAFSEKLFDNVRKYISKKVNIKKLTNDVLYDIFLDFDKYNIKDLNFKQRQNLIDDIMATSKRPYLNTLAKHEIFYALEGLYGSSHIKKGMYGMQLESPESSIPTFGMEEYHGPTPTWDDLYNFTASYETFSPTVYIDESGNKQKLIGHGIAVDLLDADTRDRWLANGVTEEESLGWIKSQYDKLDKHFSKTIKNYKYLPMELRVPILDAAYNTSGTEFFNKSKNLRYHIENGSHYTSIAGELDHSMNNGDNFGDNWLGVRSSARRAMALGQYDYNWKYKDKYGRHIDPNKPKGAKDWRTSPYYDQFIVTRDGDVYNFGQRTRK